MYKNKINVIILKLLYVTFDAKQTLYCKKRRNKKLQLDKKQTSFVLFCWW